MSVLSLLAASLLSDAGDYAAIVAATILIATLIVGWARRPSHALHVAEETIGLGGDDGIYVVLGLAFLNTGSIPLAYEVVTFTATIGVVRDPTDLADGERAYIAQGQRAHWNGERQEVEGYEFPLAVEVHYEVDYGRKTRAFWWWRRVIKGAFQAEIPPVTTPTTILAEPLGGPPTDTRVPWTSLTIFGWRF